MATKRTENPPALACDKEIRWFKLALNTACPLRCDYCFIDKDSGEVMSLETARGAVDFMLASPGRHKQLFIYGGEPFLEFDLVRDVTKYARARQGDLSLDMAICTSAVTATREQMEFLRDNRYFLSVSIDGRADDHDRHRLLKGGKPTWDLIAKRLPMMLETIGADRTMAIQCVHPDNVESILENFQALVDLGFQNIEIEIIHGMGWTPPRIALFRPQLSRLFDWIRAEALEGRHRFVGCSLGPLLDYEGLQARKDHCPFYCTMETYPDGTYSFYPFPFVDDAGRRQSAIGTVKDGLIERFRDCRFNPDTALCQNCTRDYYRDPTLNDGNDPYHWRTEMARAFMQKMLEDAKSDPRLKAYVKSGIARRGLGTV